LFQSQRPAKEVCAVNQPAFGLRSWVRSVFSSVTTSKHPKRMPHRLFHYHPETRKNTAV
jgi:hypothetical protein